MRLHHPSKSPNLKGNNRRHSKGPNKMKTNILLLLTKTNSYESLVSANGSFGVFLSHHHERASRVTHYEYSKARYLPYQSRSYPNLDDESCVTTTQADSRPPSASRIRSASHQPTVLPLSTVITASMNSVRPTEYCTVLY